MTMKTAIRTPYDVPLGLLKRSMISERVAMLKLTKHCEPTVRKLIPNDVV